jgi:hypothetical protein
MLYTNQNCPGKGGFLPSMVSRNCMAGRIGQMDKVLIVCEMAARENLS